MKDSANSRRSRSVNTLLVRLSALLGVIALVAVLVIVYGPIALASAERLLMWAASEADVGVVEIEPGDRYAEVVFDASFPSPPVVSLTPEQAFTSAFGVTEVDARGFRVELAEPAETSVAFSWAAVWHRGFELEDLEIRGLPEALAAQTDEGELEVRIEAYDADRPAALLVPASSLQRLDNEDGINAAAETALDAARRWFNAAFACDRLDEIRYRVYARAQRCPAWGHGPKKTFWSGIDRGDWSIAGTERGLEIVRRDMLDAVPHIDASDVAEQWAELIGNADAVDLFQHNHQVLDFVDAVTADGILDHRTRLTIIHFDAHSDLHTYPDPTRYVNRDDISDFMNRLLMEGRVEEVWWVAPDWTRSAEYAADYWEAGLPETHESYVKGPRSLDVFIDRQENLLYFGAPPPAAEDLERAVFHKVTLDELPSFEGRSDVYLEIDGDYFSNTGFDTHRQGRLNPTHAAMLADFARVADALAARNVIPRIVSWCLSPSYTAPEDEIDQERFFLDVMRRADVADYLLSYSRSEAFGRRPGAVTRRRSGELGRFLIELRRADLERADGDRKVRLQGEELDDALRLSREHLGLERAAARRLLRRVDRFDGRLDGTVNLVGVEYYAAVDDLAALLPSEAVPRDDAPSF